MPIDAKGCEEVLNSLPRAVFELEDRKIIFANEMAGSMFGWKAEELLGKETEVIYRSTEEYEQFGKNIYPRLEKEKTYNEMYPCRKKDGTDIICNVDIARIGDKLDKKKVVVMYEDITSRIEAEKEMQENEEQYRNYIENSHEIVQSMASDGRFLSVNNSWHKSFGFEKNELEKLNMFDIVSPEFKEKLEEIFQKALAGEPISGVEIHFENKEKQEIILEGNLIPRTFYGKVVNVRCFFRDITENRRVQQEINEKIEELEMFNKLAVDRELKMIELKNKIKELEEKLHGSQA